MAGVWEQACLGSAWGSASQGAAQASWAGGSVRDSYAEVPEPVLGLSRQRGLASGRPVHPLLQCNCSPKVSSPRLLLPSFHKQEKLGHPSDAWRQVSPQAEDKNIAVVQNEGAWIVSWGQWGRPASARGNGWLGQSWGPPASLHVRKELQSFEKQSTGRLLGSSIPEQMTYIHF